ncbi:response regulator [Cnuibacter physcomitrellae]|nr:response regulator [Cnuibacter physcomitrellae]
MYPDNTTHDGRPRMAQAATPDGTPPLLVVEDDAEMAALLRRGLTAEGYDVTVAADGLQGLVAASRTPPVLAVLDVMLSGMSGFELCRRLRELIPSGIIVMLAQDLA